MLRSAATLNRTAVHPEPPMKHPNTRNPIPTPITSARPAACLHIANLTRGLTAGIRLFKD